jgi:hypothetical protein
MSRTTRDVRELLGPLDPAAPGTITSAADRNEDLRHILASTRGARPNRRVWIAAAAGAVAMAGVATVLVVHRPAPPQDGYRATPVLLSYQSSDEPAAAVLNVLADRVAGLSEPPIAGKYQHIVLSDWSLHTRIDDRTVSSAVVPERIETWRAPDGSGRKISAFQPPVFRSDADRERWLDQGSPGEEEDPSRDSYGPGKFPVMWPDPAPASGAALKPWLRIGHPATNGPVETLVAIEDLVREQVLSPAQRAAVLRVLAGVEGLKYDGTVTDRAGRPGIGFSVESDYSGLPARYAVIFSPATGALLAFEEQLTRTAGKLNVPVPSVIGYTTILTSDTAPPR